MGHYFGARAFAALLPLFLICLSCGGGASVANLDQRPAAPRAEPSPPPPPELSARAEASAATPSAEVQEPVRALASAVDQVDTPPTDEDEFSSLSAEQAWVARSLQASEQLAFEQSVLADQQVGADQPALEPEENALLDEIIEEAIPEDYDISQIRQHRLENTKSDLPLVLNDQVVRMINYFTGRRGSRTLRATLGRAGAYRALIDRVLEEEDVPLELFHLAQAESGFKPKARSYARATGMWQFVAFRGKQYGMRQDRYLEERYDIEKATRAAARHLKDLHIEFGDWYLALAAYNSGPMRVTNAIKRGKTRDYWELSRRRLLPRQTRDYVPIILALTYASKNLDMYEVGTIDYAPALRYDTVRTDGEISLALIADLTGSSVSELEHLNQALLRSATPPYSYDLRLPEGSAGDFRRELSLVPADKRMQWRRHAVAEGETLAKVAAKYRVKADQLVAVNNIEGGQLSPGLRLTVPTTTKLKLYRTYGSAGGLLEPGTGRYKIASGDTLGGIAQRFGVSLSRLRQWNGLTGSRIRAGRYLIVRSAGVGAVASTGSANGRHLVRSGDTLGSIAQRYGASVRQLQSWNGLRGTRINVGQSLKVPSRSTSSSSTRASAAQAPPPSGRYRIRSGDNLDGIARRFGVSVADLKRWNGLRTSRIQAGKYLKVGTGTATISTASARSSAGGASEPIRYRVRNGDSLGRIANRNRTSVSNLRRWNGLRGSVIHPGQSLVVGYRSAPAPRTAPSTASNSAPKAPAASTATARASAPPSNVSRYKVRSGDTLGGIAERFGVRASDLRRWNNMRGSKIQAGKTLSVRAPGTQTAQAGPSASSRSGGTSYTVRGGDTLGAIAQRNGVSISDLKSWNNLRSNRIRSGQKLRLAPAGPVSTSQYKIRPGDTLEIIAKRFNVSIQDLKSWNGLRSSRIRAGDTLTVRTTSSAVLSGGGR